jgi:osmoprotectant transport system substrate-binding protein
MRSKARFRRGVSAAVGIAALLLLTAACGDDPASPGSTPKGKLTVGSADFGESEIIANMYSQALKKANYQVTDKFKLGSREVYIKSIESGEIDIVPEYIATLAEFYNAEFNGPDAPEKKPVATTDVDKTFTAAKDFVTKKNLVLLTPSDANDQNAFAVKKEFADKNGLTKMSDLAKLNGTLVLGAGSTCDKRAFCLPGLQSVYGLTFKEVKKLDDGGPKTQSALVDGSVDVGLVFSSDGGVAAQNLVVLDDDKKLQKTDNISALCRSTVPADAQQVLDKVDKALTTEKLQELNKKFSVDKEDASDLAEQFLKDAGLV